ncbi:hypothetical protein U1Q18_002484, partial [Sarracenia purpurea var. burkii]
AAGVFVYAKIVLPQYSFSVISILLSKVELMFFVGAHGVMCVVALLSSLGGLYAYGPSAAHSLSKSGGLLCFAALWLG